jgi:EpsI family protein
MKSMMNSATSRPLIASIRIFIVAAIVGLVWLVAVYMNHFLTAPEVEKPSWNLKDIPTQLGDWQGEKKEMNPSIFLATGASAIEDRLYQDVSSHSIKMHTAFFDDSVIGVYHNPMNCYRGNGWKLVDEKREKVKLTEDKTLVVSLTTWELERERIYVVYWYQLGEYLLYGRDDLGFQVRWAFGGLPKWPTLCKVLLEIPAPSDAEDTKPLILGFAKELALWMKTQQERDEAKGNMNCTIRGDSDSPQKAD